MTAAWTARRRVRLATAAATCALALTACDSVSGVPGTSTPAPDPATTATADAGADTSDSSGPGEVPAPMPIHAPIVVGEVFGDARARPALQAFVDDLAAGRDVTARCWSVDPGHAQTMWADVPAIASAVSALGAPTTSFGFVWSDGVTDVTVHGTDVDAGYACPYVAPAGTSPYTPADSIHAAARYLGRLAGTPVSPDDVEQTRPLVCLGAEGWDPDGTGLWGSPPLRVEPNPLGRVDSFDPAGAIEVPIVDDYTLIRIPAVVDGAPRTVEAITSIGTDGACVGELR